MPLVWAGSIVTRARKEGRIKDDFAVKALIQKIDEFRSQTGTLISYDWVNVPLVYTQVRESSNREIRNCIAQAF
jgi:bestrophin-3